MDITQAQVNFFTVELNNEANGGASPATLDSALASLSQAPLDVIIEWCDDYTVTTDADVKEFVRSIKNLRAKMGNKRLENLMPNEFV